MKIERSEQMSWKLTPSPKILSKTSNTPTPAPAPAPDATAASSASYISWSIPVPTAP